MEVLYLIHMISPQSNDGQQISENTPINNLSSTLNNYSLLPTNQSKEDLSTTLIFFRTIRSLVIACWIFLYITLRCYPHPYLELCEIIMNPIVLVLLSCYLSEIFEELRKTVPERACFMFNLISNFPELIAAFISIKQNKLHTTAGSLNGSIISNCSLLLFFIFFFATVGKCKYFLHIKKKSLN